MIQLDWSLSNSNEIAYCHGRRFVDKPLDESRKIGKVAKIAHNRLSLALLFSSEQIGVSSPADFAKLYRMLFLFRKRSTFRHCARTPAIRRPHTLSRTPGLICSGPGGPHDAERRDAGGADRLSHSGANSGAKARRRSSPDNTSGVAMIRNARRPVRATTSYFTSSVDQTMIEQSNHDRVSQLVQALVFWLSRDLGIRSVDVGPHRTALLFLAAPTPRRGPHITLGRPRQFCVPCESQEMAP
jgi:hypothetical protein